MQRVFGGPTFEPLEKRRDKELTLGPTTLILLGLGLFTLCGVCFVFGYAMGQHGSPALPLALSSKSTAANPAVAQNQSPVSPVKPAPSQSGFQPKPAAPAMASDNTDQTPARTTTDSGQPAQIAPRATPTTTSTPPQTNTQTHSASVLQAALPGQSGGAQPAVASGPVVRPALQQPAMQTGAQPGTWMVQIAAVSHPEDADVLVSALRKHGYAVSMHRDPVDALIHVHVGPFESHNEAAAMRQKLLNDGYNAIVQP
jgi:DedD protein